MNYDNTKSTLRENWGYSNAISAKRIRRERGDIIADLKYREEQQEKAIKYATKRANEKGYTKELVELGKLCAFIECFDNIPIIEQNIPQVGPFENPTECESFIAGYNHGKMLVQQGLPKQAYNNFVEEYNNKFKLTNKTNTK